jgi:hypothetical protein
MANKIRIGVQWLIGDGRVCLSRSIPLWRFFHLAVVGCLVLLPGLDLRAQVVAEQEPAPVEARQATTGNTPGATSSGTPGATAPPVGETPKAATAYDNKQGEAMGKVATALEGSKSGATNKPGFEKSMQEYIKAKKQCIEDQATASTDCDDSTSPILHSLKVNSANALAAIGTVMGSKDPCNKFADAMKVAATLLPMFGQSCSSGIASCKSSCGMAINALQRMEKLKGPLMAELETISADSLNKPLPAAAATKEKADVTAASAIAVSELGHSAGSPQDHRTFCAVRAMSMMAQGIQQANGAMQGMGQANGCNDDTNGAAAGVDKGLAGLPPDGSELYCMSHPSEPQCNCGLSQNAETKRCICMSDARNPYCNGGPGYARGDGNLSKLGVGSGGALGAGAGGGKTALNLDDEMSQDPTITLPPKGGDEPAARGGAGGGGMGGGSGSGNQMGAAGGGGGGTPAISKATSPSGFMGGGGAASKLSNNDGEENGKRGPAAGKPDPNKVAAAEFAKQVSPLGGRTNWEKVKIRYNDNARTLIQK